METGNYGRLAAEFYDAYKPTADDGEIDFFAGHLEGLAAPALEAMCGSGRLLLPLFRRGYPLEGVDNAPAMLENLNARCQRAGRTPPVTYLQSIATLSLAKTYPLIFIALGSFQLLPEEDVAPALARLRAHLTPEGRLLVDTFLPWDIIESPSATRATRRKLRGRGNGLLQLSSQMQIDVPRQRYQLHNHYERLEGESVTETEQEELTVRWYFPEELMQRLEEAGFSATYQAIPVASDRPRRVIYTAYKKESAK